MKLFRRYATEATRRQAVHAERRVAELTAELDIAQRERTVVEAERDALAAVVARNTERIKAESAAAARTRAQHEGESL